MKFEFTEQEVMVIAEALSDAPFKKVASVIQNIQRQINMQGEKNETLGASKDDSGSNQSNSG
jgi:hypothetical protein